MSDMLKSTGNSTLWLRFGTRICVCMHEKRLDERLRILLRPLVLGRYAFWCDKPHAS